LFDEAPSRSGRLKPASRLRSGRKPKQWGGIMMNIPTELLRTLVAVVDRRSFTKAAQSLSVTQPTVSAQIKRLQGLLGYEVFHKSAAGLSLTPRGEIVVGNARRLLAINDDILHLTSGGSSTEIIRVGIPNDYSGSRIPTILTKFRRRWPDVSYTVRSGPVDTMLDDIERGDLDLVLGLFDERPAQEARHLWTDMPVWVHSQATRIDPVGPVPLVGYGDDCACQRVAVAALHRAGRECNFVFTSYSLVSLAEAVTAGFGVMVMPHGRAERNGLAVWADPPLPDLPELYCGIYIRDGGDRAAVEDLADYIAKNIRMQRILPGMQDLSLVPADFT
jgi:DNA-binding transcriptional LysR family regulator